MQNLELYFLLFYIFFLPIAHVATIQAIFLVLFTLTFLKRFYKKIDYKAILFFKSLLIAFLIYTLLAFLSLFNTPDLIETLKELKGELLENLLFFLIFFYYALCLEKEKFRKFLFFLGVIFVIHGTINLIIWIKHGGWPYRSAGLLDPPGGERFGIWITYMLGFSLAIFKYYPKYGILALVFTLLNVIANQVRATFLATILIFLTYVYFFTKKRFLKIVLPILLICFSFLFYSFSEKLPPRYNLKLTIKHLKQVWELPPKEFNKIPIDPSIYERLSMWKSALLYKFQHPFSPEGFGRFLYGKSIKEKFKNSPENLPTKIYPQVHNDFIGTFYSLGILGLFCFLFILGYKLKIAYQLNNASDNLYEKMFGIFVFLGTVGYMVSIMFGSFFGDSEAKFFYLLYGFLLGRFADLRKK